METKIEKQYNKILDEIKTLDELIQTTEYTHNTTKELKQSLVDQEAEYTYNEIRYNGYFDKIRDAKIKLGLANETERKS